MRADRGPARRGRDARPRAAPEPRPHGADPARLARAVRARDDGCAVRLADRRARARRGRRAGRPLVGRLLVAAAALVPGSRSWSTDVGLNWTRTGFLRIAERMGAVIVGDLEEPGTFAPEEPIGDLDVAPPRWRDRGGCGGGARSRSTRSRSSPCWPCSPRARRSSGAPTSCASRSPTASPAWSRGSAAWAPTSRRPTTGSSVRGTGRLRGGMIDARGDHRLAMLGAVAGLASEEGVEVEGMEAAAVSYPGFERDLEPLLAG